LRFTQTKFQKLSSERRIKKILDFSKEIEINWDNEPQRREQLGNLQEFLGFYTEDRYMQLKDMINTEMSRRDFLKIIIPIEQACNIEKRDADLVIKRYDSVKPQTSKLDLILVLDNLRSAFNVGAIVRTAECFGITKLYFCGYTPDNERVAKTAMGTRELVAVTHFKTTEAAIETLRSEKRYIYALETVENADSIYECEYQYSSALIVGNEALGIAQKILQLADQIIEIPLSGWKNSLNVGVATAITIAEIKRKSLTG